LRFASTQRAPPAGLPAGTGRQLVTVPVAKVDTITVTFDRDMGNVSPNQVTLFEVLGQTLLNADDFASVTYSPASRTVEIKLNSQHQAGQYELRLSVSRIGLKPATADRVKTDK